MKHQATGLWRAAHTRFSLPCRLAAAARALLFSSVLPLLSIGQNFQLASNSAKPFREDRLLVKPKAGGDLAALNEFHRANLHAVRRTYPAIGNLQVIQLRPGTKVEEAIVRYQASGLVQYAEPDYILHGLLSPNDPLFAPQWNLFNWGQEGGTAGADIHATNGWELQCTASNVLVAVVDSGVRYTHEDLVANMWNNPGEIAGNGIDDDHNGYIDDIHGINAITGSGNPMDDHGHGSHVAGIIGAGGSNNVGVAGVAWRVKIMACKFLDFQLQGALSDAIEGIDYARSKGAKIINASWGMPSYNTQALYDAINATRQAGMLFVAACGNSTNNNDTTTPIYPASFNLDNIIAVAATTRNDTLASFSSYGPTTVDLGAPGDTVLSCWADSNTSYNNWWGTSMAAPHVAGVCALVWARVPNENYLQIKNRVLAGVDPIPALAGKCVTGGRLNLRKALENGRPTLIVRSYSGSQCQLRLLGPANARFIIQSSSTFTNWISFYTNQTSSSGILDFTDPNVSSASRRFYRALAAP